MRCSLFYDLYSVEWDVKPLLNQLFLLMIAVSVCHAAARWHVQCVWVSFGTGFVELLWPLVIIKFTE